MSLHPAANMLHSFLHGVLRRPLLGALVMAVTGILGSLIIYMNLRNTADDELQSEFIHTARDRIAAVRRTLDFNFCILKGTESFYNGSEEVTRREFHIFVAPMLHGHPSISALEWVPRVSNAERKTFEQAAALGGLADFQIIKEEPQGIMVPVRPAKAYYPIFYIEPFRENAAALGLDLGSIPACREAMDRACGTGRLAATGRVPLYGSFTGQFGVRFFQPVYRPETPLDTVEQRRANLWGFIVGVFRIPGVVEESVAILSPGSVNLVFQDETNPRNVEHLYTHRSRTAAADEPGAQFADARPIHGLFMTEQLDVGGRTWRVDCTPTLEFISTHRNSTALLGLLFGLLMTSLTASYLVFAAAYQRNNERLTGQLSRTVEALQKEVQERANSEKKILSNEQYLRVIFNASKREAAKLSAMISNMQEGIVFADSENVIVEVNDYFCRLMGKRQEEILGKRIEDFHTGDILAHIIRVIGQFRQDTGFTPLVQQRKLGDLEVVMRTQPIYRDGVYDGVLLNVIDVTELVQTRKQAEVATEAKSQFLAMMSHEIRTPMTAILGYTDLLRDPGLSPNTRSDYLTVVRRNAEQLLQLINDILDLSKIEAGKMQMNFQPCHLVSLVADVASLMRPRAEQHGTRLEVRYTGAVPETITTDGDRLRQALINLVGNAAKFTENGSIQIIVSFLPQWHGGQSAMALDVVDTGIGILPEVLPQLFRPFVQANRSTSRKYGGTGLGLTISRQIINMLGGELGVRSAAGKGSTFSIIIPTGNLTGIRFLESPTEAIGGHREDGGGPVSSSALAGVRILLAEDSIDNQELLSTFLTNAGAEVEVVENGKLAVEKAPQKAFHVVLMDMNMPEMDGYEATRMLRHNGYARPILALTANAMSGDDERCLAAGCNMHLAKPVERAKLIQTIADYAGVNFFPAEQAETEKSRVQGSGFGVQEARVEENPDSREGSAWKILRSQFADDPELSAILPRFIGRLPERIQSLQEALKDLRFEELERLAHRLKGSGGGYGFPALTEAAWELQEAAKAGDAERSVRAFEDLREICGAIQAGWNAEPVEAGKP
jgi:PAS domain S-box-containing protein